MHISLITDGIYPYVMGGMQKHSYYLAKYLAREGAKVDVYHAISKGEKLPKEAIGFTPEELNNLISFCHVSCPPKISRS